VMKSTSILFYFVYVEK